MQATAGGNIDWQGNQGSTIWVCQTTLNIDKVTLADSVHAHVCVCLKFSVCILMLTWYCVGSSMHMCLTPNGHATWCACASVYVGSWSAWRDTAVVSMVGHASGSAWRDTLVVSMVGHVSGQHGGTR